MSSKKEMEQKVATVKYPILQEEINSVELAYNAPSDENLKNTMTMDSVKQSSSLNSSLDSERQEIKSNNNSLYNGHPFKLRRSYAFFYINDYPLVVVGPDCM